MKKFKRYIALILSCSMLLSGCGDNIEINTMGQSIKKMVDKQASSSESSDMQISENGTLKLRDDSANNATLQDDVVTISESDTENTIEVNQAKHSITISNMSKELDGLRV